jgi:hypothetical protein
MQLDKSLPGGFVTTGEASMTMDTELNCPPTITVLLTIFVVSALARDVGRLLVSFESLHCRLQPLPS